MPLKLKALSVLVVEDVPAMRDLLVSSLKLLGVGRVYATTNGESGFEEFCRERPDIVLTDWVMEPMNGIELTKLIRTDPRSPNQMAPIILVTGYSALSRIVTARDAGVTELLIKPFRISDLAKRLTSTINKPRDFVIHSSFVGPDRRRKRDDTYAGPFRRASDAPGA